MQQLSKKKRRPFVFISVTCCFLIGLAITLFVLSPFDFSSVEQILVDANENEPITQVTELTSPINNMQLFAETYEASNITYTIEYPQMENDAFNAMMIQFVNTEKEQFLSVAKDASDNGINKLTTSANAYSYNDRFYSITFHTKTELNNEEPAKQVSTFVYDKKTAQFITLQQLLDDNKRYLQTLNHFVYKQLKKHEVIQANKVDEQTLQKFMTPLWDLYPNFAIENNKLVIYLGSDEIAQLTGQIISVRGDMTYLNSILAEPFQSKLSKATKTLPLYVDNQKRVALTFDDGPHKTVTKNVLAVLDEFDAKATFFMIGKNVKKYPDVAKAVHRRGHEIGNHTWSHPILTKLSLAEAKTEYERAENIIFETTGEHSTVFRPPFGATNKDIKAMISQPSVNWSVDTLDWKHRNSKITVKILKNTVHNNAVVLMHDIHQPTAESLRAILQYLQNEGYEFLTISELMPYVDYNM